MVRTWANAAKNAVAAGFDTIEVHMAHGYLLASFLSPISNTRNDEYGGDRKGRMKLPLEIVEAVRREMPDSMPLFVRVSSVDGAQNGWSMDDTVALAHELKARGVDVVDCSSGGISGSATAAQVPRGLGFQVPYAERVRKEVGVAAMAVGIILEAEQAEAILEKGQADLIAVGRQSQYNPNIAHHWAHDLGINRKFEDWAPEYGWWLEKRIRTMEGFATPTGAVKLSLSGPATGIHPGICEEMDCGSSPAMTSSTVQLGLRIEEMQPAGLRREADLIAAARSSSPARRGPP